MSIVKPVACLAALVAIACTHKAAPASVDRPSDVPFCEEPHPPQCPRESCGTNSPIINSFPVNGMRSDGECNYEGIQLLPHSLRGGEDNACNDSTLEIRDGQLIGIRDDGTIACDGDQLKGATFVLRSWVKDGPGPNRRTMTVRVADIAPTYQADAVSETRMAYRLTGDDNASLCSPQGASAARSKLGLDLLRGLTPIGADKDFAIAVSSELYDASGAPIQIETSWRRRQAEWTQLACVDDALAKRSLYDLYTDNVDTSRAALQMLVANYCGDLHATVRGAKIEWGLYDDSATPPKELDPAMLEAKWGPKGAVCVSKPRALYLEGSTATVPRDPHGDLEQIAKQCPNCSAEQWAAALRACQALKGSHPPFPPRPTCEKCTGDECKGRRLHSYVHPTEGTHP